MQRTDNCEEQVSSVAADEIVARTGKRAHLNMASTHALGNPRWRTARGLTRGMWLTVIAGTACVGIIGGAAWWQAAQSAHRQAQSQRGGTSRAAPDITTIPTLQDGRAFSNLGASDRPFLQIADKDDPTRLAAELEADHSTPLEGRRYRMERPKVWVFMRDGRTARIEADVGQALIPDNAGSRPEDGTVEGNVVVRMYAPEPNKALPNLETAKPILTLHTNKITFDFRVGEFRFPDEVTVKTPTLDFAGRDVLVLLNEANRQLELLRVEKTHRLVLSPAQPGTAEDTTATPMGRTQKIQTPLARRNAARGVLAPVAYQAAPPPPAPQAPSEHVPVETRYLIDARGSFSLVQGAKGVTCETFNAFMRVIDGKLPAEFSGEPVAPAPTSLLPAGTDPARAYIQTAAFHPTQPSNEQPVSPNARSQPREPKRNAVGSMFLTQGSDASKDVVVNYTGPLEIRLLKVSPEELADTDIFVRCQSPVGGGVVLTDSDLNARGTATLVEYATHTRATVISGTSSAPARLEQQPRDASSGGGIAIAERFEAYPAQGLILAKGLGTLNALLAPDPKQPNSPPLRGQRLSWSKDAQFNFGVEDGEMVSRLETLRVRGTVMALDAPPPTPPAPDSTAQEQITPPRMARIMGEELDADFTKIDAENSFLSRVEVRGNARAGDGASGSLAAEKLLLILEQQPATNEGAATGSTEANGTSATHTTSAARASTSSDPVRLEASGNVRAEMGEENAPDRSVLLAQTLDVDLKRIEKAAAKSEANDSAQDTSKAGTIAVTKAVASGDVSFKRADGVGALTPHLTALPQEQLITLSGPKSSVGQNTTQVKGNTIILNGIAKTLNVEGAGEFVHSSEATEKAPEVKARATWSRSMTFDDAVGLVSCRGGAVAEINQGTLSRDTLKAEHVQIAIAPQPPKTDAPSTPTTQATEKAPDAVGMPLTGSRRVLWAQADGAPSAGPASGDPLASLELRRYAKNAPERLEKLMYLEGTTIKADNDAGTLHVPSAGKLLTMDTSESDPSKDADAPAMSPIPDDPSKVSARGTALFTWNGSFVLNRAVGQATMRDGVRLVHRTPATAQEPTSTTQLECTTLVATLDDTPNATLDRPFTGALRLATAEGSVWFSSNGREMVANRLVYDALARSIDASAPPTTLVTVTNPGSPTPIMAEQIIWDLKADTLRLLGAQPISAPR